jgi:ABC-type branched-subunit amino acid transport system ATPase component
METYEIMKTGLCFIPQDRSLFNTLTVTENLAMAGYTVNDKKDLKLELKKFLRHFQDSKRDYHNMRVQCLGESNNN